MIRYLLLFFNQFLISQHFRRYSVHFLFLLFIIIYAFGGGLIFYKLESDASKSYWNGQIAKTNLCIVQILRELKNYSDETVKHIERCWKADIDETAEWNYVTSTLYGFGIMTTLGYNRIAPITSNGRLFSILYGIFGIPVTMIAITVTGRHLNTFVTKWRQKLETFQAQNWSKEENLEDQKVKKMEEPSSGFVTIIILSTFLAYIVFGAVLLPLLNGEIDFVNGLYYNFLCLTAIDFGQLIPRKIVFLPITFIYVCVGLALATIAIEDGSKYVRKLQYIGERIKNVAATKIWFGGKTLKVRDVLHAVGKKCGIEPSVIDEIDLDTVIEEVIAQNEGKLPPSYINEENPISSPETTIKSPSSIEEPPEMELCFAAEDAISTKSSEVRTLDTYINEKVVVTQIFQCDEITEAIDFVQAEVMGLVNEKMSEPSTYMAVVETVNYIDDGSDNESDKGTSSRSTKKDYKKFRKFKERKKLYATDPQNLYRLYEQEWERIKNLATHRRRQAFQPRSNNNSTTQMSSKQLQSLRSSVSHETSDRSSSPDNKQS